MTGSAPSPGHRVAWYYGLVVLGVFTITRVALALWTGRDDVPLALWPGILVKGLWFDVVVVATVVGPVLVYEAVLPNRWRAARWHHVLRLIWFWLAIFILLFIAIAEATFWNEFSTRFNFIAVDYLLYTHEVIGNIRESYPVGAIFGSIAGIAALITLVLAPRIRASDRVPLRRAHRLAYLAAGIGLPAALLTVANVDQMEQLGNSFADELSGNGMFTFAAAMRRNELDYDRFYPTIPQEEADSILAALGVDRKPLHGYASYVEAIEHESTEPHAPNLPRRPRNVVLITVESLSAEFLGAYGSKAGLTPRLDQLANEGLRFANMYATGTRTVRGLEAVSLGTPPIPGQAIVRRPANAHLSTIGEILDHQGFATAFVYGGYGYFDNMNAYFGGNNYKVVDRTDFPKETVVFENIWGVADESLFDNALKLINESVRGGRPVFMHVMTTSNHRPYTYPSGRIDIASPGGRAGGIKYTDWAIGKLIDDARREPWFDETLFVIVADHCAAVAGRTKLPVAGYRIPMILYAPKLVVPGVYQPIVSQIDIPPMILDVLQVDGDDYFFGRSMFELSPTPERAFISNYQSLGYLRKDKLVVLSPGRRIETFAVDPETYESTPVANDEAATREAIAYYQTAARSFRQGALNYTRK